MLTNAELLKRAKRDYRLDRDHNNKWKRRARECYDYYAGRQWPEKVKADLESQGRAATVMNRIKPRVSAVVGMEISNRQELRFAPREPDQQAIADLFNRASEWTRDQAETEDHETEQFQDMVICGMGWSETVMSYEDNFDGIATTQRRNPLLYDWDCLARQANLVDARHIFFSQDLDPDDAKSQFPKMTDKFSAQALGISDIWTYRDEPHDTTDEDRYPNEAPATQSAFDQLKSVRIVEYQYFQMEPMWRVMSPRGAIRLVDPKKADELIAQMKDQGQTIAFEEFDRDKPMEQKTRGKTLILPYVEQFERRFYRSYFSGDNILEHKVSPCPYTFTHHAMTAWRDENKGWWFGMVEGLIDPQMWSNKFFSQAIYIYTVNPKGGVYYEKNAVPNPDKFKADFASPDAAIEVSDGAISGQKILERKPGQYPTDLDKLTAFAIDSLPALDGLNPEVMGMAGRDQPGLLEKMRKQAGMTILAPLFDARRRYHKRQGKTLMYYISKYFTDTQLMKIVGKGIEPDMMRKLRDQDVREYDVVVDDAPASPNMKEYVLNILMETVKQAPQVAAAIYPILIKYSPLPQDIQEEVMKAMAALNSPEKSPQFLALQQMAAKLQEENQTLKAKRDTEMAKIQVKAGSEQAKHQLNVQEAQTETQLEMTKMRAEMELEREKMMQEMKLEVHKMLAEIGLKKMEINLQHEADMEAAKHKPTGSNGNST